MKSYLQIQVPSLSLTATRGAAAGPAGSDRFHPPKGRRPGPAGGDQWRPAQSRLYEETIRGGSIMLELDRSQGEWRITPPAFAHWQHHLPATHGRWARGGDEMTISDAANRHVYFSLRQANKMAGRAVHRFPSADRRELATEWKRVPKPLPVTSRPPIWYGLAIANHDGQAVETRTATAIVLSEQRWFTFAMPQPAAGTSRGYFWSAAFVLLTGYLDRGDCVAHPGRGVDYELALGRGWAEQAGALDRIVRLKFDDVMQFAFKHAETLRALGMAAVRETCIDYDEKHVIIGDLAGPGAGPGIYAYTGQCVQGWL
jgi:hypothetical protein